MDKNKKEKRLTSAAPARKSKMSGWWAWTILTVLWTLSAIILMIVTLRTGGDLKNGSVLIFGAVVLIVRCLGQPPTFGRGLLLFMGCYLSVAWMTWFIVLDATFDFFMIAWTTISIFLILYGMTEKKQVKRTSKLNKFLLIVLCFFFGLLQIMSIYVLSDKEPMFIDRSDVSPEQITPKQPHTKSDTNLKKASSSTASPVNTATPAPEKDAGASKVNPYVSYPDNTLFELLGIDMDQLLEGRDAFKNTFIHVGWMDRVNEILKDLNPEKKAAIIKNQTSLLYVKEKLNEAYLTGKIDHETFIKALGDLMKWHQRSYESILTEAEYESLFKISPEKVDDTIDALLGAAPEYSFILNQEIPVEAVKEKVQGYKLEEVNSHFKKMVFDRDNIGKQITAGEMTPEQAREILIKEQHAFIAKCKEILTEDEINTIFGSVEALEAGASQTEPPKVEDDDDLVELGFRIDNPNTSIDDITKNIDKAKIEDITFFYQQREQEREELISKLDAEEISEKEVHNISKDMDAAFEENCKSTLTDAEYQMIFDTQEGAETKPADLNDAPSDDEKKRIQNP